MWKSVKRFRRYARSKITYVHFGILGTPLKISKKGRWQFVFHPMEYWRNIQKFISQKKCRDCFCLYNFVAYLNMILKTICLSWLDSTILTFLLNFPEFCFPLITSWTRFSIIAVTFVSLGVNFHVLLYGAIDMGLWIHSLHCRCSTF